MPRLHFRLGYSWLVLLVLGLASCDNGVSESPSRIFAATWQTVNDSYSLFAFKGVDWQAVRATYEPEVREDMSEAALFDVLIRMLSELRDSHVSLSAPFDRWAYDRTFLDTPDQVDFGMLRRFYFPRPSVTRGGLLYDDLDDLGYLSIVSFGRFDEFDLDVAAEKFASKRGIILDVRDNGGGARHLAEALAYRVLGRERVYGFSTLKDGPGPDDFSEQEEIAVTSDQGPPFVGPIAVLMSRSCYSACNLFVQAVRNQPGIRTFGEQSGGGGGAPITKDLPNGWQVRFTATRIFDLDGVINENGFQPDESIDLDPDLRNQGVDTIIEAARSWLLTQQ